MRNLEYVLSNGDVVSSYSQAVNSGLVFKAILTAVPKPPVERTPKAQAMIDKFGFVSPAFKDLV